MRWIFLVVVVLTITITILLSLPSVQTLLAGKAVNYLNENFNLNASIGRVHIKVPNRLSLKHVYVADDHGDTLIYARQISVIITGFDQENSILRTSDVHLLNGRLYMRKYQDDEYFNFQNFLNKLKIDNSDPEPKGNFIWKSASVRVDSMRYIKHRLGCDSCTNIFIDHSTIRVSDFSLNGGEVDGKITSFSYIDRYRFDLLDLSANVAYHSNYLHADSLRFITEASEFDGDVQLIYTTAEDLNDFEEKVNLVSDIRMAEMSSNEFIEWMNYFPDFGKMKLTGKTSGTLNDLYCHECDASIGNNTSFFGDVHLTDVTDVENMIIDAGISYLKTNSQDYSQFIYPLSNYQLPKELNKFDRINLSGKYTGGIDDFKIVGIINTNLGKADVDLNLQNLSNSENLKYRGDLAVTDLDVGKFLDLELIGKTSFKGQIEGKGLTKESIDFKADLDAEYFEFDGYHYNNITFNGRAANRLLNGDLTVNDQSLKMNFDGEINFVNDTSLFVFQTEVNKADLYKLGLSKDTISILATKLDADFRYYDINSFSGFINIVDPTYEDKSNFYFFDEINLNSRNQGKDFFISAKSQIFNANLSGDFKFADVIPSFKVIASKVYNFYQFDPEKELTLNLDYDIELNNTDLVTSLIVPKLNIESGTSIKGSLKMPESNLNLEFYSPGITYDDFDFNDLELNIAQDSSSGNLSLNIATSDLQHIIVDSTEIEITTLNDSLAYSINAIIEDSIDTYLSVEGVAKSSGDEGYELSIQRSKFNLGFQNFQVGGDNKINWQKEVVKFDNLYFKSDKGNLSINGTLSNERSEVLRLSADSFNISVLDYFIGNKNTSLSGTMNGDFLINQAFSNPHIISEFTADSLSVNEDWIGDIYIDSDWNYAEDRFELTGEVKRGKLPSFNMAGVIYPDSNTYIDLDFTFNKFRVNAFNVFLEGVLSDLRGSISGDISLNGPLASPEFNGKLEMNKVGMKVPYLNTQYNIVGNPVISVIDTAFILPRVEIRDSKEGTKGWASGSVSHNAFDDLFFDLLIEADNMLAMDLEKNENAYFYGHGYGTGTVHIIGPVEELLLDIIVKTEKGTDFKMPITSSSNVAVSDFITFKSKYESYQDLLKEENKEIDLRGLSLKLQMDITPDARAQLIMDETVGDMIEATGSGKLRLEMSPNGEIKMFGDYVVNKGDYLFTMRNLINKPFRLKSGGTMEWKGDPYNADLHIDAIYSTRTNLDNVVTSSDYVKGQRVSVDLVLKLTGPLLNPNIAFEILLPNSNPTWQDELNNRFTNTDNLNQQAFSLLMLNQFWDDNITNVAGQGITANTSQMLFTQFSNWISKGTGDFIDINMAYSSANTIDPNDPDNLYRQNRDELEIALSKNFYDDRITVNGILDVPVGSTDNSEINTQTFAGDVEVLYKLTKDGRVQAKFFNRSNQNNPTRDRLSPYTQGIGLLYRTDFDNWSEFFSMLFKSAKKEEEQKVNP